MIEEIQKLFADKLSRPVSSPDEDLFETGILDSMVLVELLLQLEQSFGLVISIADLDLDRIRTVRSIAELAEGQPLGQAAADRSAARS
jgi:D-alanine--poly(phosphoribitol) ligase subunit 2